MLHVRTSVQWTQDQLPKGYFCGPEKQPLILFKARATNMRSNLVENNAEGAVADVDCATAARSENRKRTTSTRFRTS